jgi:hypothetical protein
LHGFIYQQIQILFVNIAFASGIIEPYCLSDIIRTLGDWCWSKVPAAVFIQSGLAFYLNDKRKVVEVKCRGLPVKNLEKAQAFFG